MKVWFYGSVRHSVSSDQNNPTITKLKTGSDVSLWTRHIITRHKASRPNNFHIQCDSHQSSAEAIPRPPFFKRPSGSLDLKTWKQLSYFTKCTKKTKQVWKWQDCCTSLPEVSSLCSHLIPFAINCRLIPAQKCMCEKGMCGYCMQHTSSFLHICGHIQGFYIRCHYGTTCRYKALFLPVQKRLDLTGTVDESLFFFLFFVATL